MLVDVKKSNYKQVQAKRLALQQQHQNGGISASSQGVDASTVYPHTQYTQGSYNYPPPQAYAGWGYPPPTAAPYSQPAPAYGGYAAPATQSVAPQQSWNGYAPAGAPTWGGQGTYSTPPATNTWSATPAAAAPSSYGTPPANGWGTQVPVAPQAPNFGTYQQSYNGGPQKNSSLQGNRMNPYSV